MKKIIIVLSLLLTLTIGTVVAYADSNTPAMNFPWRHHNNLSEESREKLLEEREEFRKNEIERALENGTITESEAKEWEDHFDYMDEFHTKNGFIHGGRGYGRGCHGMMRGNR